MRLLWIAIGILFILSIIECDLRVGFETKIDNQIISMNSRINEINSNFDTLKTSIEQLLESKQFSQILKLNKNKG